MVFIPTSNRNFKLIFGFSGRLWHDRILILMYEYIDTNTPWCEVSDVCCWSTVLPWCEVSGVCCWSTVLKRKVVLKSSPFCLSVCVHPNNF
jgi:hypothetical protein